MSTDPGNQLVFLREMEQAKDELSRFRNEIDGLAEQMNGIETDIVRGKKKVRGGPSPEMCAFVHPSDLVSKYIITCLFLSLFGECVYPIASFGKPSP